MANLAAATSLSLPPAPPAQLLDIQSLPSLEKFDSQLLDLIKGANEAGQAGINVMDEFQAPDDDLALQRLMSLTRNKSSDAFNTYAQQQLDAAAANADAMMHRRSAMLRGQLQHHQLAGPHTPTSGGPDQMSALAEYMKSQQAQGAQPHPDYLNTMAAQQAALAQQGGQDMAELTGAGSLADALAGLSNNPNGFNAFMESLRSEGLVGAGSMGLGGNMSAALNSLGLPAVDGPSSAVAQRKRANRGTRLTDIIKVEKALEDGDMTGNDPIMDAAAAMAAALQQHTGGGGSDSRDSTQSPRAKRRKGAGGSTAAAAAAAAAALADAAGDSDYEGELHSTSHLHITADMDEETKTRLRREKNRIAARKCRAKKNALMTDLQSTLAGLMRKNEEYKLQMVTWHKMFSREVRLREAMKRIIAVMWSHEVPPAATGYTANDIIIGIESGTLDLNSVLRSFAAVSAANGTPCATPSAAAAAAHAASMGAHLASPPPLMINGQMTNQGLNNHRTASTANTPRSPAAAAAAEAAMAAADAAAGGCGGSPVQGLVPQHLLMSHMSGSNGGHGGGMGKGMMQGGEGANMVLNAAGGIGGKGMMGMGDGNALNSPIPSVAAAALVDLAAAGHGNGGQGFAGLDPSWGWSMEGGLTTPSQVGPSCITTGME